MGRQLSPENEAFLMELVARHEFADRMAAIDEAVGLLRDRWNERLAINAGLLQLSHGHQHGYQPDELERFLANVSARDKQRHPMT